MNQPQTWVLFSIPSTKKKNFTFLCGYSFNHIDDIVLDLGSIFCLRSISHKSNIISTIKMDNFLYNSLSYSHNVSIRERIVQKVVQFNCTNNISHLMSFDHLYMSSEFELKTLQFSVNCICHFIKDKRQKGKKRRS
jgi:hypothetical protein